MKKEDLVVGKIYLMDNDILVYFCGFNQDSRAIVEPLEKNKGTTISEDELDYCGWESKGSGLYWRYAGLEKELQETE